MVSPSTIWRSSPTSPRQIIQIAVPPRPVPRLNLSAMQAMVDVSPSRSAPSSHRSDAPSGPAPWQRTTPRSDAFPRTVHSMLVRVDGAGPVADCPTDAGLRAPTFALPSPRNSHTESPRVASISARGSGAHLRAIPASSRHSPRTVAASGYRGSSAPPSIRNSPREHRPAADGSSRPDYLQHKRLPQTSSPADNTHVYTHVCTHVYTHAGTHAYTHAYTHADMHAYANDLHAYTHMQVHMQTHMQAHMQARMPTHTCLHTDLGLCRQRLH